MILAMFGAFRLKRIACAGILSSFKKMQRRMSVDAM
jgi:hypothetical protein